MQRESIDGISKRPSNHVSGREFQFAYTVLSHLDSICKVGGIISILQKRGSEKLSYLAMNPTAVREPQFQPKSLTAKPRCLPTVILAFKGHDSVAESPYGSP